MSDTEPHAIEDWDEAITLTETAMAQGVAEFVRKRGLALAGHTGNPFGPDLQLCTLLARNALYALPVSVRETIYRQMYLLAHTQDAA